MVNIGATHGKQNRRQVVTLFHYKTCKFINANLLHGFSAKSIMIVLRLRLAKTVGQRENQYNDPTKPFLHKLYFFAGQHMLNRQTTWLLKIKANMAIDTEHIFVFGLNIIHIIVIGSDPFTTLCI